MSEAAPVLRMKDYVKSSEAAEPAKIAHKQWSEDQDLVEAKFDELIDELRDIEAEKAKLDKRSEHARTEIERLVKEKPYGVRALGYQSLWHPPSKTTKLDKTRLVAAGVTPDQLKAGTVESPKKGYLEIRKVKDEE